MSLERGRGPATLLGMTQRSPFWYFRTSPEIIRLAVMMYVRFPLSLRNVEDLLHERGIEVSHETVRFWWQRFGPMFAAEIRRKRVSGMRASGAALLCVEGADAQADRVDRSRAGTEKGTEVIGHGWMARFGRAERPWLNAGGAYPFPLAGAHSVGADLPANLAAMQWQKSLASSRPGVPPPCASWPRAAPFRSSRPCRR